MKNGVCIRVYFIETSVYLSSGTVFKFYDVQIHADVLYYLKEVSFSEIKFHTMK